MVVASLLGTAHCGRGVGVGVGSGVAAAAVAFPLPAEVATPCGTPLSLPCLTVYCDSLGPLFDFEVVFTTLTLSFGCGGGLVCFTGGGVCFGGGVGGGVGGGGVGTMT